MPHIKANGINLYYQEKGKGTPLILLPGFGQHSAMWKAYVGPLSSQFRTITIDNRGSGQSAYPAEPYSMEDCARDTASLMDKLSITSAHLLSNSMGTAISLQMCLDFPDQVERVVLCAPFPTLNAIARYRTEVTTKLLETEVDPRLFAQLMLPWLFSNQFFKNRAKVDELVEDFINDPHTQLLEGWKAQLAALTGFDIGESAHKIPHEILLIAGENDLYTPLEGAEWLCDQILNAELNVLKGQGHAFSTEKAEEVLLLAQKFLTRK